jgi:hypothetical protein
VSKESNKLIQGTNERERGKVEERKGKKKYLIERNKERLGVCGDSEIPSDHGLLDHSPLFLFLSFSPLLINMILCYLSLFLLLSLSICLSLLLSVSLTRLLLSLLCAP